MEIIHFADRIEYYQNGLHHREDGPAIEWANGKKKWFFHGQLHREDGPAIELLDGSQEWHRNNRYHRLDGPAVIYPHPCGYQSWYVDGKCHRENAPAREWADGSNAWFLNGVLHRLDGPAFKNVSHLGKCRLYWYLNGCILTERAYLIKRNFEIILAIASLPLSAYVVLWILEWINPNIIILNQPRLVQIIQNIRNRQSSKFD